MDMSGTGQGRVRVGSWGLSGPELDKKELCLSLSMVTVTPCASVNKAQRYRSWFGDSGSNSAGVMIVSDDIFVFMSSMTQLRNGWGLEPLN